MVDKARARMMLDADDIERSLKRIACEVLERNKGAENLILLRIPTHEAPLARRLRNALRKAGGVEVPAGPLDITIYRDDPRSNPIRVPHPTNIPDGGIDTATVVLVGDVFHSDQTIHSALETIASIGRSAAVQLATLVDRRHRKLPIRVDYVGKNPPTSHIKKVRVSLAPVGGADFAAIEEA